jgi:hypothetical protein
MCSLLLDHSTDSTIIVTITEFLKSIGLTGKTSEYFQCSVYFGVLHFGRTGTINGQIITLKNVLKVVGNSASHWNLCISNLKNSSVFVTGELRYLISCQMNTHFKYTIRWSSLLYLLFSNYKKTWMKTPNDTTFIMHLFVIIIKLK